MSRATQELLNFVRQLPEGMAYAPIYCAGSKLQSGKESKGKAPLERSHHQVLNPADVALQIERRPDVFQAVGVFTGARSAGLVILDVDRNLSRLLKKWGETLEGAPKVTSTKANAAKYLAAEAGFRACETAVLTHGGFGYAKEYHVERYMRECMLLRIAPVSIQLIMCHIAEKVLGLPKSY